MPVFPRYELADADSIPSPALLIFRDYLLHNLRELLRIAGSPDRLRPHCKTHKIREIVRLQLEHGITKHKCATVAEAEMLAQCGVTDVLLAYNVVGPNIGRVIALRQKYPELKLSVTADHPAAIESLSAAAAAAGVEIEVLLDIDCGMHRTGVAAGTHAEQLYRQIAGSRGLKPGGLHVYDGHVRHRERAERREAVLAAWEAVAALRDRLTGAGLPVPRIVAGGTGTFPVYAEMDDPALEMSPGTPTLYDAGYAEMFPDLPFVPAAVLLTRVVSLPAGNRVTCDLGYKACASDPPAGRRLVFLDLPDAREVLHNEEHLVLETAAASRLKPGDVLLAIPRHICPTTALHREAWIISGARAAERWTVAARDRVLTI